MKPIENEIENHGALKGRDQLTMGEAHWNWQINIAQLKSHIDEIKGRNLLSTMICKYLKSARLKKYC